MEQNNIGPLQQLQNLLTQISNHIFQINSIITEMNNIINQHNQLELSSCYKKMNNYISKNNNLMNFNVNLQPNFNKKNIAFNLDNLVDKYNNHYKIRFINLSLDEEITVNEMLILFLKKIGREDCINKDIIDFMYNDERLKLGDPRKIKETFKYFNITNTINVYNIGNII